MHSYLVWYGVLAIVFGAGIGHGDDTVDVVITEDQSSGAESAPQPSAELDSSTSEVASPTDATAAAPAQSEGSSATILAPATPPQPSSSDDSKPIGTVAWLTLVVAILTLIVTIIRAFGYDARVARGMEAFKTVMANESSIWRMVSSRSVEANYAVWNSLASLQIAIQKTSDAEVGTSESIRAALTSFQLAWRLNSPLVTNDLRLPVHKLANEVAEFLATGSDAPGLRLAVNEQYGVCHSVIEQFSTKLRETPEPASKKKKGGV